MLEAREGGDQRRMGGASSGNGKEFDRREFHGDFEMLADFFYYFSF